MTHSGPLLVTGATGFLGGRLCQRLRQEGRAVRALVRREEGLEGLRALGVEVVSGSLEPPRGLEAAVSGISACVHCAGGGKALNQESFYRNNRDTTCHLLEALTARQGPLTRLVMISTLAARGPGLAHPEDRSRTAPLSHYGRAKAAAEAAVLAHSHRFPVTLLRPPALYGPGDTRMLPLFRAARRGWVPLPGPGLTTSLLHGDDCVEAVMQILTTPHPSGSIYTVCDGVSRTHEDLVSHIGEAVGTRPRTFRVPRGVLRLAAQFSQWGARLRNREALLTLDKVGDLCQPHWECDFTDLHRDLGWTPRIGLAEGVRTTASWYRLAGWL